MYYHLFTLDMSLSEELVPEMVLDCFFAQEFPDTLDDTAFKIACKIDPNYGNQFTQTIAGMNMRRRFSNAPAPLDGIYLIKTGGELTREDVECIIQSKVETGEILQFIKDSKFV